MNKNKYVFAQLIEFLNNNKFRRLVDKYDGNRYVKNLTCWNQLLSLMFGQLSNRESLRDLIVALEAHKSKCFHLGLGRNPIAKTTLATANQNRDYRISTTSPLLLSMTPKPCRKFPMRQVLTTSSIEATITLRSFTAYCEWSPSLSSEPRPICSTSASNGNGVCLRTYSQMQRLS